VESAADDVGAFGTVSARSLAALVAESGRVSSDWIGVSCAVRSETEAVATTEGLESAEDLEAVVGLTVSCVFDSPMGAKPAVLIAPTLRTIVSSGAPTIAGGAVPAASAALSD
jgi:hypothetical protein